MSALQPSWSEQGRLCLGQHRNTYIVATDGDDLLLFDQHTAHERIRFESIQAQLKERRVESQLLLAPAVLTIAPRLRPLLEQHQDALRELGFDLEEFGGDTVHLRALPAVLPGRDPARGARARSSRTCSSARSPSGRSRSRATAWPRRWPATRRSGRASRSRLAAMSALVRDLPRTAPPDALSSRAAHRGAPGSG